MNPALSLVILSAVTFGCKIFDKNSGTAEGESSVKTAEVRAEATTGSDFRSLVNPFLGCLSVNKVIGASPLIPDLSKGELWAICGKIDRSRARGDYFTWDYGQLNTTGKTVMPHFDWNGELLPEVGGTVEACSKNQKEVCIRVTNFRIDRTFVWREVGFEKFVLDITAPNKVTVPNDIGYAQGPEAGDVEATIELSRFARIWGN